MSPSRIWRRHIQCAFDAVRNVVPIDWPSLGLWVVIQAKPGARVEGSRYPGWGSGIIILGREGRGKEGRRSNRRVGVRYGTLLRIMCVCVCVCV